MDRIICIRVPACRECGGEMIVRATERFDSGIVKRYCRCNECEQKTAYIYDESEAIKPIAEITAL